MLAEDNDRDRARSPAEDPNGLVSDGPARQLEKFHGVRPASAAKLNRLGIKTGFDLREQTLAFLQQHFGKPGPYYYWIARGVDERPVHADRTRKSIGAENTF